MDSTTAEINANIDAIGRTNNEMATIALSNDDEDIITPRQSRSVSFRAENDSVVFELNDEGAKKQLSEHNLKLASVLVRDAKEGNVMDFKTDDQSLQLYTAYREPLLTYTSYFFIYLDLLLVFFETPFGIHDGLVPFWACLIVEGICIAFFLLRFVHNLKFANSNVFWRDAKNVTVLVTIILNIIDIVGYLIWIAVQGHTRYAIRWSRVLRPLYYINNPEQKQVRRAFRNIRRTIKDIVDVIILFFFVVLLWSLMGLKLFENKNFKYPNGSPYFTRYIDIVWDLYVLVTTANNPDVMMPAYDNNKAYAFFFMSYSAICNYIIMSIVLAVIYNNYKKHLKNEVRNSVYTKRKLLSRAFDLLSVRRPLPQSSSGSATSSSDAQPNKLVQVVTKDAWLQLMSRVLPKKRVAHHQVLFDVLNLDSDKQALFSDALQSTYFKSGHIFMNWPIC